MDYFSDLMESYEKLKKRTFKLTYILEADTPKVKPDDGKKEPTTDAATTAKAQEAADAAIADAPEIPSEKIATKGLKVTNVVGEPTNMIIYKNVNTGAVGVQGLGPQGGILSIEKNVGTSNAPRLERNQEAYDEFVKKLSGESDLSQTARDSLEQDAEIAQQEAEAEQKRWEDLGENAGAVFLERIDEETGEPVYNVDLEAPNNIKAGVDAIQATFKDIKDFCLSVTTKPKPKYCEFPGMFATGQGNAAWGYKLANGQAIGVDGESEQIPPGLLVEVSINHREFMEFLTGEGDCDTVDQKVGIYGDKLMIFGDTQETGVVINTKNDLQIDALEALKKRCPDFKEKQMRGPSAPNNKGLNQVRGTVDEKCMVAAVALNAAGNDPKKIREALKGLAEYISGKGLDLIEYARGKVGEEDVAKTFDADSEEAILMEQAQLAQTDGGEPLVRYTLMTIRRHMAFVKAMGADSAGDLSKAGGSGARSDTVFYYKKENYDRAVEACKLLGLDPEKALTPSEDPKYAFELGIGQKDKIGAIKDDVKCGEYNTTVRRRASIRGELGPTAADDPKFQEGFTEWADELQFGDITTGEGKERWDAFLEFEEQLESDVSKLETTINDGNTYVYAGKIKTTQPEQVYTALGNITIGSLSYAGRTETELGRVFYGPDGTAYDPKNAATRQQAAEYIGRQARIKRVQEAVEDDSDPVKQQAAKDWIIRNAIMTGGNYRDIVTNITSHDENRSLVYRHNEVFQKMADPNADVSFDFKGSSLHILVDGLVCKLGFERTYSAEGVETRTDVNIPVKSAEKMGRSFDGPVKGSLNNSTLHQYMVGQMRLLETLINQTKSSQAL